MKSVTVLNENTVRKFKKVMGLTRRKKEIKACTRKAHRIAGVIRTIRCQTRLAFFMQQSVACIDLTLRVGTLASVRGQE